MDEVCRLCCSTNFVNNDIFDEENALYLKMSLYLPIKVFKNDRLPQRVCDKCSCKVNDLYQFCNETIATQHRLRAVLISNGVQLEETVDLTLIKHNTLSPAPLAPFVHKVEPTSEPCQNGTQHIPHSNNHERLFPPIPIADIPRINNCNSCDQATQTEDVYCSNIPVPNSSDMFKLSESNSSTLFSRMAQEPNSSEMYSKMVEASGNELFCRMAESMGQPPWALDVKVKQEPLFKQELDDYGDYGGGEGGGASDCSSEDITLSTIKKERKKRKKHSGERKKKPKLKELQELVGSALALVPGLASEGGLGAPPAVKTEPVEYHCCICFLQCYSRTEMLHHYKAHLSEALSSRGAPPAPPPPPATDPLKCMRCQKTLSRDEWDAHWLAHWERDARPLRCALCEKTFRDHAQVLRHGLTHKPDAALEPAHKRFACDVCGEAFVFMRCLLAHRLRAHPEAAARALAARCALCDRTFAHLNSLRRHLRAHTGERNFLCSVCGKALSSREHLKFHLRIHANYKPNVCKTCGKGFVKKCNLTLHERVHSGEKPHVCAHCGKAFSQRSTLVIHERYHSGARPYVCGLCGRGFVAKGLLSMHLKTTCI